MTSLFGLMRRNFVESNVTGVGFVPIKSRPAHLSRVYPLSIQFKGNLGRPAEVLGLERSHLYGKMKSLGIAARE